MGTTDSHSDNHGYVHSSELVDMQSDPWSLSWLSWGSTSTDPDQSLVAQVTPGQGADGAHRQQPLSTSAPRRRFCVLGTFAAGSLAVPNGADSNEMIAPHPLAL